MPTSPISSICEYSFNEGFVNGKIQNMKNGLYDLSLVNVGVESSTILHKPPKGITTGYSLYQTASSTTSYSYLVNNSSYIKGLGKNSDFSVSFSATLPTIKTNYQVLFSLYSSSTNMISLSRRTDPNVVYLLNITIGGTKFYFNTFEPSNICHFVITYNGSTKQLLIYTNNVRKSNNENAGDVSKMVNIILDSSGVINVPSPGLLDGISTSLYILGGPIGSNLSWPADSGGSGGAMVNIFNFNVYNSVLNDSEIEYLYLQSAKILYRTLFYLPFSSDTTTNYTTLVIAPETTNVTISSEDSRFYTKSLSLVQSSRYRLKNIFTTTLQTTGFTIGCWIRLQNLTSISNQRRIFSFGPISRVYPGISVFYDTNNNYLNIIYYYGSVSNYDNKVISITQSRFNNLGWHHVCVAIDNSNTHVYFDGKYIQTISGETTIPGNPNVWKSGSFTYDSSLSLHIGNYIDQETESSPVSFINGLFFCEKPLTVNEINRIMWIDNSTPLFRYKFDGDFKNYASGTGVDDASYNNCSL